jgi:hypothetical protein
VILFRPEHVEPILRQTKTQTRRQGKKRWNVGAVHQCQTKLFGSPFAAVRIMGVRRQRLKHISDADLRAEGYGCLADYKAVFRDIYGEWNGNQMVWVIDFELIR